MAQRLWHSTRQGLTRARWQLAGLTALLLVLACVLVVPQWLVRWELGAQARALTAADKAKAINDVRTTLLQGIGGTVLLLGAYFTYRQLQTGREQVEAARQQTQISAQQAREQLALAQQGQITERFSRAIEQLGSDKEDVQLGGIYTLERIANDSPKDRRTTQAVLGAYVRTHARWLVGSPEVPQHPTPTVDMQLPWLQQRAPAVNTAVVVLGRRPESQDELQLILSRVDLRGAYLPGARLSNTLFRHSNLARAQLPQAQLEGADLEDADLRQAKLPHTHLAGANLRKAHLQDSELQGADLRRANLCGANLHGAHLDGAKLENAQSDPETIWPEGFDPRRIGVVPIDRSANTENEPHS
jgi:Pentapeptide repeats (8 copies)